MRASTAALVRSPELLWSESDLFKRTAVTISRAVNGAWDPPSVERSDFAKGLRQLPSPVISAGDFEKKRRTGHVGSFASGR